MLPVSMCDGLRHTMLAHMPYSACVTYVAGVNMGGKGQEYSIKYVAGVSGRRAARNNACAHAL